jgi:hypothetical protein
VYPFGDKPSHQHRRKTTSHIKGNIRMINNDNVSQAERRDSRCGAGFEHSDNAVRRKEGGGEELEDQTYRDKEYKEGDNSDHFTYIVPVVPWHRLLLLLV